jgi:hypothetical protein
MHRDFRITGDTLRRQSEIAFSCARPEVVLSRNLKKGRQVCTRHRRSTVWVFTKLGEPIFRIKSCAGMRTTNVAFGGQDNMTFITEAEHGVILAAQLPVRGRTL